MCIYTYSLRRVLIATGALTATVLTGGCAKRVASDPRLQPPRVEVVRAVAADSSRRTFTGVVAARVQSDLGFRVGGKILERCVDEGQRVKRGQILMRLDPEDLGLAAAAQRANVASAQAECIQAKADESRTFEARYVLEGDAAAAPLGSTVTITVATAPNPTTPSIALPIGAVCDWGAGPGVWIVDSKSEVKFRPIVISAVGQEEVIVSRGVQVGERVVALGAHLLHDGQAVALGREETFADARF